MNLQVCTRSSWSAASEILLSKSVSYHERQATATWEVTVRYGTWLLIDSPQAPARRKRRTRSGDALPTWLFLGLTVPLSHSIARALLVGFHT